MRSIQLCIFTFRTQDLIEKFPINYRTRTTLSPSSILNTDYLVTVFIAIYQSYIFLHNVLFIGTNKIILRRPSENSNFIEIPLLLSSKVTCCSCCNCWGQRRISKLIEKTKTNIFCNLDSRRRAIVLLRNRFDLFFVQNSCFPLRN